MTGGGDLDEIEDDDLDVAGDEGDDETASDGDLNLNESDPDPTAGASDIGGRAGDDEDRRGADGHEAGGGHTGMGQGPTGS